MTNTQGADVTVSEKKVEQKAAATATAEKPAEKVNVDEMPTIYTKEHCPKCKGAEQRFKIAGISFIEVNCTQNIELAKELGITQTPTIIDPDGTRFEGANAAIDWMKAHGR